MCPKAGYVTFNVAQRVFKEVFGYEEIIKYFAKELSVLYMRTAPVVVILRQGYFEMSHGLQHISFSHYRLPSGTGHLLLHPPRLSFSIIISGGFQCKHFNKSDHKLGDYTEISW